MDEAVVAGEAAEVHRHKRLLSLVRWQAVAIIVLTAIMVLGIPVMRPYYQYEAMTPEHQSKNLVPLLMPNLTTRTVLAWAATSITEILTFGFGDLDQQLMVNRKRFTSEGWESLLKALIARDIRDAFKRQQLVLTTVPANTAVLTAEGEDVDGEYIWIVEMPIIMTYMTNNNVTKKSRGIVNLTITRVPSEHSTTGIAIKKWDLK